MTDELSVLRANTILYCKHWRETVEFYRRGLGFPVAFANDWFIEFALCPGAFLSVADERRSRFKSKPGSAITLTLRVPDLANAWQTLRGRGLEPGPMQHHPWGAQVFYVNDPEGHRIEFWAAET